MTNIDVKLGFTKLTWRNIETLVAGSVWKIYRQIATEEERTVFLSNLREAHSSLNVKKSTFNLKISRDYAIPCMGEAYALWYHMLRADNIFICLKHLQIRLKQNYKAYALNLGMNVLDVGSGTGSGVMAVSYFVARFGDAIPKRFSITCVENAVPMRTTASYILPAFFDHLIYPALLNNSNQPFTWKQPERIDSLEACAKEKRTNAFDLILFSHTFHSDLTKWSETQEFVVEIIEKHLRKKGVVLFLTPKEDDKPEQMRLLTERLKQIGATHISIEGIRTSEWEAPIKHSPILKRFRNKFNKEAEALGIAPVFPVRSNDDYPYYWFKCLVDAFLFEDPKLGAEK